MNQTFRLGRVAGVRVGMHWTVLITMWLVAYVLAEGVLPADSVRYGVAAEWAAGTVAGILLWLSLLAHEVAHVVVARRQGLRVEGITLWLVGGVTSIDREPPDPGTEMRIAAAGPLASLGVAIAFAGVGLAASAASAPALVVTTLLWLATINVLVLAFNLLPAAPLDGATILRAALFRRSGERTRVESTCCRVGVGVGYLLAILGLLEFTGTRTFTGIWLAIAGILLVIASKAEKRRAAEFGNTRVAEVMSPAPVVVPGWMTVDTVVRRYGKRSGDAALPVRDFGGDVTGLLLLRQITTLPPHQQADTSAFRAALPRTDIVSATPEEPVVELLERMAGTRAEEYALVLHADRLVGILSRSDIARAAARLQLGLSPREPLVGAR